MALLSRVNVTTTPTLVAALNGNRKSLLLVNRGTADIYIGADNTVSSATGVQFRPQEQITLTGDPSEVWAVASSGTQRVDTIEVA